MSSRLETLQVARLAPQLLAESSRLVESFVRDRLDPSGGFRDREGKADLYYTVFGIDCLLAIDAEVPSGAIERYLDAFADGDGLDLVHLACLAHCWSALPDVKPRSAVGSAILERVAGYRAADGGFADRLPAAGRPLKSSLYSTFMGVSAYDNLGAFLPDRGALGQWLVACARSDGAYADGGEEGTAITTLTAAALSLKRNLELPTRPRSDDWLLAQRHTSGGFLATPGAPMPDLLSTAVALHALAGLEADLAPIAEPCLDFVDTLWTNRGAFHGHWADDEIDCEYTFYGLLALGHLSVWAR